MRAKEFIEFYKNHASISCHDLVNDFGVTSQKARTQIFGFKKSGVLIELTKWVSNGRAGTRASTYKINTEYVKKYDHVDDKRYLSEDKKSLIVNCELEITSRFNKHVQFKLQDVLDAIPANKNTIIDNLVRMCSSGKMFKIGTEKIGKERSVAVYSFIKPDSSGIDFLIQKLIGGTVTKHPAGRKFEACTRHSSDDCIKSNNSCGGASVLHTGYGTSTSHTGSRRYE